MNGTTVADFHQRFVVENVSASYPESPTRCSLRAESEVGSLQVDQLSGRYFSISRVDMNLKYSALIEVNENLTDKVAFYMLHSGHAGIPLFGHSRYHDTGHVDGGECYLAFNPSLNEIHQFDAQVAKPLYLEITADYFASLMDDNETFMASLKDKILDRQFFGMKTKLTSANRQIADSMYECPLHGSLGNLMMEGSLQQFVAMQLSAFIQPDLEREKLSRRDRDVMHGVKEYLDKTFLQNHNLHGLAKRFGINQNKLKKAFKKTVGVPVIEYLYDLKMNHARELLYDEGQYVSKVAAIVGYKNANHFATAFKRKFGMSPSRI